MDDTNDNKPSDSVPFTSTSASPSSNTDNLGLIADQTATIAVVHASVGSGHKVAAEAIAEALEHIVEACKERFAPVPTKINVEVLDILSFGRIVFDGDKAASMFT